MAVPAARLCRISSIFLWIIICLHAITTRAEAYDPDNDHEKPTQNWINHGGDIYNRRYASNETKISPESVSKLKLKWEFYTGTNTSATPAIYNGILYFPAWNGYLYAVKAADGSLIWKQSLQGLAGDLLNSSFLALNPILSRSTPTIAGDLLIVGIYGPAFVFALEQSTGKLVWSTQLEIHYAALITMSGTYYNGAFYVGTSSSEEVVSIEQCCTFRGSFLKLDIKTGKILWKTYMLPDNHGNRGEYAGAAVWGSSPSIDISRNHVYIATGNLYSAPLHVRQCQEIQNNESRPSSPDKCVEPDNHSNSMLALDLDSGGIVWYKQLGGYDVWFIACNNLSTPNCPPGPNPDADFSEAPIMLSINVNGCKQDLVVAVQKSGFAWALNRSTGSLIWSTEAGPGGLGGGGYWGAATDENRVYTNIANSLQTNFTLKPSKINTTAGGWVAMDGNSGEILWSTADPSNRTASGPVSVANGVLFGGSTSAKGPIYAMNARNGKIVWSYETGGPVYGGVSISDGCVFVGNGYRGLGHGTSLFAFCILDFN